MRGATDTPSSSNTIPVDEGKIRKAEAHRGKIHVHPLSDLFLLLFLSYSVSILSWIRP